MKIMFAAAMMITAMLSRGAELPYTVSTSACCGGTPKVVVKEAPKKEVVVVVKQAPPTVVVVAPPMYYVPAPAPVVVYPTTFPVAPVQPRVIVPEESLFSTPSTYVPPSYGGYGGYVTSVYAGPHYGGSHHRYR